MSTTLQSFLSEMKNHQQITHAFRFFRNAGLEPILIKGWSVGRFYLPPRKRPLGDIDLCFKPSDYVKAEKLLQNASVTEINPGLIDIHKGLRHLDTVLYEDLFKHSRLVSLSNYEVRVLRPEDALRVVCVHWLTDGGANKEKLWDVYYLVANRPQDFDWSRCLNVVSRTRRHWIICTITLAHRYLNLKVEDLPFADEIKNPNTVPKWLITALEKEWSDSVDLVRLASSLDSWKDLKSQLKKRFPPNPIQSSINTGAPFNNLPRLPFQIADVLLRFVSSINRNSIAVYQTFSERLKGKNGFTKNVD